MKIVEIVPQLASGGGERFVVDLCNELVSMGHEVMLIVLHRLDNPLLSFYLPEVDKRVIVKSLNKKKGADITLFFRIRSEIKAFKADIVHTHLSSLIYVSFAGITLRSPRYYHTLHSEAKEEAENFISTIARKVMFRANLFEPVTISEESQRSFQAFYGVDAPMIFNGRNVPAGLLPSAEVISEMESVKLTPESRVIVNLATIYQVKRQDMIARVCQRLAKEKYDFVMLMIGHKANQDMVAEIEQMQCPNVRILGPRTNPLEYLAAADAYCLMSSYEGMPISLIEALGCGAIPICTPVGGIVNVIKNGENGFLAKDISEDACYEALKRFLDCTPDALKRLKQAARVSYAPFSMTDCAKKYLHIFSSSLS